MEAFSWEMVEAGRCRLLLTTDWQLHFAAMVVGLRSVLISGLYWPRELADVLGFGQPFVATISDARTRSANCPCIKPSCCHARGVKAAPCWSDTRLAQQVCALSALDRK